MRTLVNLIMQYELIDHTADFGIRIFGNDINELFENAAFALFDLIIIGPESKTSETHNISVTGEDWPDLMVNWLRELLYFWTGLEKIVVSVKITAVAEFKLSACIGIASYDPVVHEANHEIKAVTWHGICVEENNGGWMSSVILDV